MKPAPCADCGSPLAAHQRYCVECGLRVGPPLMLPYAPLTPAEEGVAVRSGAAPGALGAVFAKLPMPGQTAAICAGLALGFGVIAGTAISPSLTRTFAGGTVVVQAPPPEEPEPPPPLPPSGGGGGGTAIANVPSAGPTFSAPVSSAPAPSGGSGGESKPKKEKEKPTYATGVVVHQNPVASSYTLDGGSLRVVHTGTALPPLGTQVKVPVRDLANGTVAEDGKRQAKGTSPTGSIAGIVTYNRDSTDPAVRDVYTVSARGVSMQLHSPADATGQLQPPPIGSYVRATVDIKDRIAETPTPPPVNQPPVVPPTPPALSCAAPASPFPQPALPFAKGLYETALTIEAKGVEVDSSEINGVVQAVCAGTGEILLSADDVRETGADLFDPATGKVVAAAPGVSLAGFAPGQPVTANVSLALDGTGTVRSIGQVTGIRDDSGIAGADSEASAQGDLK